MLARLDGRAVLAYYKAQNCRDQINRDGTTEVIHSCLLDRVFTHHSHGDAVPSAALNIDKNQYCCYSSGIGCSLEKLVSHLEGDDPSYDLLSSFVVGATKRDEIFQDIVSQMFTKVAESKAELPTYSYSLALSWHKNVHPYWESRGISRDALDALTLGFDEREDRVVFPHMFKGDLVGWQKRAVGKRYPKYQSSWQFPKSETLYNYDNVLKGEAVCVVESPMSVARALSVGLRNVVATFGAKVSDDQIDLLSDYGPVCIWFDHDDAGFSGERKLCEGLYRRTDVWVVPPDQGRDMGDCTLKEMTEHFDNAIPGCLRITQYSRRPYGKGTRISKNAAQRNQGAALSS